MKTNLKRIGAWALCFMLLLSCIPVSADDGLITARDYSAGYSLDSATWITGDTIGEGQGITASTSGTLRFTTTWTIPIYFYTQDADSVSEQNTKAEATSGYYYNNNISPTSQTTTLTVNSDTVQGVLTALNGTFVSMSVASSLADAKGSTGTSSITFSLYSARSSGSDSYSVSYNGTNLTEYKTRAVYVKYAPSTVTATFDTDGGSTVTSITDVQLGDSITLPEDEPTKEGYTFLGWKVDGDETLYQPGESYELSADTTFTAQWSEKTQQYIAVDPTTLTIGTGLTQQLSVDYLEGATQDAAITWSVADDSIASVSEDGVVTAITPGTTTVTATYTDGEVVETATCVVIVVATAALYLDQSEIYMVLGSDDYATFDLTALYDGANANPEFSWTVSDSSVVSLSVKTSTESESDGKSQTVTLTALSAGTATVTVTAEGLLQQCAVTVVAADTDIQDAYFYLLKPAYNLDDKVNDPAQKWYTIGPGKVKADSATNHAVGYTEYDLNVVQWPDIAKYAPVIEVDNKKYTYASSGSQEGTYTIQWMYRKVDNGANNANSDLNGGAAFVPSGTYTWHIDGCIVLHDATKMNINYKVKQPGSDSFTLVFLTGSEAAPSGQYYPQVVNQNYEYTVESQLGSKTYNNETYDFDGWYTDEACTQKVTSSTITIVKDIVFYGKYVRRVDTGTVQFKKIVREPEFTSGSTTFSFTLTPVSVNTEDYNKWLTANSRLFSNGTILVTVAGQAGGVSTSSTVTLSDLPVGTYTLAEVNPTTDAKEYTTTYQIGSDAVVNDLSATLTVTKDSQTSIVFTNTFVPKTADLTITKNVANLPADNLSDDVFTFTVKDSQGNVVQTSTGVYHGGSCTFEGLEAGAYTVTETVASATDDGTAHSYEMTAAEGEDEVSVDGKSFQITIEPEKNRDIVVTNTCNDTVDLTVRKIWEDSLEEDGEVWEDWFRLRPETVSVTLNVPAGVTIPDEVTTTVTLEDSEDDDAWSYTWEGLPKYNGSVEIAYTVSEDAVPDKYAASPSNGQNVSFTNGLARITNTVQLGYFRLEKTLNDPTYDPDEGAEFSFTFVENGQEEPIWEEIIVLNGEAEEDAGIQDSSTILLPIGTYTITETEDDAYNTTVTNGNVTQTSRSATFTLTANYTEYAPYVVSFTNTRKTYSLTVTKQISGNMANAQQYFDFTATLLDASGEDSALNFTNADAEGSGLTSNGDNTVSFQLKANDSIKLEGIPYGYSVSVTETGTAGYTVQTTQDGGANWTTATAAGDSCTATVGQITYREDVQPQLTFKNTNNATIDTGVTLDFLPYVLLILGVGVAVALWLVMSANKRKDD